MILYLLNVRSAFADDTGTIANIFKSIAMFGNLPVKDKSNNRCRSSIAFFADGRLLVVVAITAINLEMALARVVPLFFVNISAVFLAEFAINLACFRIFHFVWIKAAE